MLDVSSEYKKAVLADTRQFKVKCAINQRIYTEEVIQSINWSGSAISGETFAIGSAIATDVKLVFSRIIEGIEEAQEVKIDIGLVLPNGEVEYVPLGIFLVTSFDHKRNDNQTVIEGMDRFIRMEGLYKSNLQYPARIKDVAIEIANLAGVPLNQKSFERLSIERIDEPEGYTLRQAIGLIAQFEAGFATFNRRGELEIRQLSNPNYQIKPSNYYSKGLDKNEALYRINGIQVKTGKGEEILKKGNLTGNQVILDNKVMTEHLLTIIYNRISSINFYPFQLKWQGDLALEVGDWLTIIDLKGNRFTVPNLHYSLSFNGGLSAQSSASQKSISQTTYQSRGVFNQIVEEIHGRISAEGGSFTYEGLDTPLNPREGDMWFKPNGADTEIWLYKKDEQERFRWVLKVSTAENPEIREKLANQQTELEQAKQQIEENNKKAQQAITSAGFANNGLSAVERQINLALKQTQEAFEKGQELLENVTTLQGRTTELAQKTDRLDGLISQSVQQIAFDKIKRMVEMNTATIEQTAKGLLLKADKTMIDGILHQVTRYGSELSIQEKRIQSLVTETTDVNTKVSQLVQTQNGFQQTVTNQLENFSSQQTQLASQYQRVIENIGGTGEAINISGKWQMGSINGMTGEPFPFNSYVFTDFIPVESGKVYLPINKNQSEKSMYFYWYDEQKRKISGGITSTAQVAPLNAKYLRASAAAEGVSPEAISFGIIEGSEYKSFIQPLRSQLIQTAERFNQTITKGELIAQLNIEAGKTLIQNQKIFLDAETVAFSGRAFIPVALIKDLRVDAATIYGTLNAANVRVINVDAGNLSSGYINNARLRSQSITADKLATNAIQVGFNTYSHNLKLDPYSLSFYNGTQIKGKLTSEGMEFWHGSRKIGRMGENSKIGNDAIRGVSMNLEYTGDYISWSYRNSLNDSNYTTMLLLDPRGKFSGKAGIHIDTDVYMNRVKPAASNAKEFLKFGTVLYNSNYYSSLLNNSGKSGVMFGGSWLYLVHDNQVIPVEDIKKIVYALKGLGTVQIPTSIRSYGGTVAGYKTINL